MLFHLYDPFSHWIGITELLNIRTDNCSYNLGLALKLDLLVQQIQWGINWDPFCKLLYPRMVNSGFPVLFLCSHEKLTAPCCYNRVSISFAYSMVDFHVVLMVTIVEALIFVLEIQKSQLKSLQLTWATVPVQTRTMILLSSKSLMAKFQ